MTQCIITDCETYQYRKEWCVRHYVHYKRYGDPVKRLEYWSGDKRACDVVGCRNHKYSNGYCYMHGERYRKYGNPLTLKIASSNNREKHPLYKVYHAMLDRCRNPESPVYHYYGGRGIHVCNRWQGIDGFDKFVQDMGERPKGLTLERIDNDKGYSPRNCKWATRQEQAINRGLQSNNTSGIKGVHLYGATGRWSAHVYVKRKKIHLGYFDTMKEAQVARLLAEKQYKLKK